jgi:IMP cyclohydrolase
MKGNSTLEHTIMTLATTNFTRHLQSNAYPGRGLVVGRSTTRDAWLMIYWLMGRSTHSQNRRFVLEGTTLRTEAVDASQLVDPSLIIYEAMLELPGIYLLSNGDQTRTLYTTLQAGGTFDEALATRTHEPDAPHYTPRISAMLTLQDPERAVTLSMLKANAVDPTYTDRITFRPALPLPGLGVGLTTYQQDGMPLPSFQGEPLLLPCIGSSEAVLDAYWNALNRDYRIAIAVKEIPWSGEASRTIICNRCDGE